MDTTTAFDRLRPLDGLRALAIGLVVLWHCSIRGARHLDALRLQGRSFTDGARFVPHGEIGVCLFFAISGFVIAIPFLQDRTALCRPLQFWLRRGRRLYPSYLVALATFALALLIASPPDNGVGTILWRIAAAFGCANGLVYDAVSPFDPPMWSFETEIQFYLLAPALLFLYTRGPNFRTRISGTAFFCATLMAATAILYDHLHFDLRFRYALPTHLPFFAIGIAFADMALTRPATATTRIGDTIFGAGWLILYAAGIALTANRAAPLDGQNWAATLLTLSAGVGCVMWGSLHGKLTRAALSHRHLCAVGLASYSIYLVHVPVMEALNRIWLTHTLPAHQIDMWLIWGALSLGAACVASSAFHALVDAPLRPRTQSRTAMAPTGQIARLS